MTPIEHARTASDALQELARTTIGDAHEWPSDVDTMVGELALTVARMDQVLGQAARWLRRAERYGVIGHDQGLDVAAAVLAAAQRLEAAAVGSVGLAEDLDAVREITAHLIGVTP